MSEIQVRNTPQLLITLSLEEARALLEALASATSEENQMVFLIYEQIEAALEQS